MSEQVKDMISKALDDDFNKANNAFSDIMTIKLNDLLDQEKVRIADSIYNGVEDGDEEDDPDQLELDLETEGESESDEEADEEDEEDEDDEEDLDEE